MTRPGVRARPGSWPGLLAALLLAAGALALGACGGPTFSALQIQTASQDQLAVMESALRARVASSPDDLLAAHNLARVLLRRGRPDEAEAFALRAANGDPFYGEFMATLGEVYLAQQKRFRALTALAQAVELDKGLLPAYVLLAVTYEQLGDLKAATATLNQGKVREPRYYPLRYHLARMYFATGDLGNAATATDEARRIRPTDRDGLLLYVRILKAQGRFALTEYTLQEALANAPHDVDLLYEQLDLHYQRQEWPRANAVLERIEAAGGLQPREQLIRIGMLQAQGQRAAAAERLALLRRNYPTYQPAMEVQAGMQVLGGQYAEALELLRLTGEMAPLSAEGHFWRAVALYQLNRPLQGDEALAEALRRDPGYPRVRLLRIRRLIQQRRITEATPLLDAYLKELPADAAAVLLSVDLLTLQGNYPAAMARLELLAGDADRAVRTFAAARVAYLSGDPAGAVGLLAPLLQGSAPSWRWAYLSGAASQRLERYGDAIATLTPFLPSSEAAGRIHRLLAETQSLAKDDPGAQRTLLEGLRLHPRDPGLIEGISRLSVRAGDWKAARDWLETGAGLVSPYRAILLDRLQFAYRQLNQPDQADKTLRRYLDETDPLRQDVYMEAENSVLYGNMVPAVGLTILPPPTVKP
ncbi:MAG: tetratricopeptide repeat protein [Candidatus Lambdaproteobacteria bacterium]|nr:tetratricopeptide repeat protein [Candidatus Lambdaproteobacteria bacterium]